MAGMDSCANLSSSIAAHNDSQRLNVAEAMVEHRHTRTLLLGHDLLVQNLERVPLWAAGRCSAHPRGASATGEARLSAGSDSATAAVALL